MPASLTSTISTQGFHFSVSTAVHITPEQNLSGCALHIVHKLDPHVYADQYELAQRPDYNFSLWGTSDLERPVSAVDSHGSTLLVSLPLFESAEHETTNVVLDVPLHARYGRPVQRPDAAFHTIHLAKPFGFFSCPSDGGVSDHDLLRPFQRLNGWPSSSRSLILDSTPEKHLQVTIPVGVVQDLEWVDVGTTLVMIAMFLYILVASVRTARRLSSKTSRKSE